MVDTIHKDKDDHDDTIGQHYCSLSNNYPSKAAKNPYTHIDQRES